MSELAAARIISYVKQNPTATICLAAGNTPIGTYQVFSQKVKELSLDLSGITFVSLDEWAGINGDVKGSCRQTLDQYLYKPVNIPEENILFFDGKADDLNKECKRIVYELHQRGGLDFTLLGIGLNGHVGFNEPDVPMDKEVHVVSLNSVTQKVSGKYFEEPIEVSQGITLGMKTILASNKILLIASGDEKAGIVERTVRTEATSEIPASLLKARKNSELIVDSKAGKFVRDNR
ncbi:glucosamine-6-phosphate deaminase [Halobacillus sp. BBL2006]|uniref:glucosamine-6-phosphate deaminase n=1 Tax=Halobacillus sp. BBL2006 TaxID=1543706 RepID=UPI0005431A20|nr:glucosamine-6-phosphate deaminase [Halobacillus sp. BBL2006]KHE71839.1 hypothetical protein LD39_07690 [Halobacillus sp. BBL2006]